MANFRLPFQRPRSDEEHFRNAAMLEMWGQRYASRIGKLGNQAVTAGIVTVIQFDTVTGLTGGYDERANFEAANFGYRVKADGLYAIESTCHLEPVGVVADYSLRLLITFAAGGTAEMFGNQLTFPIGGIGHALVVSDVLQLRKGDLIQSEVSIGQNTTISSFPQFGLPRLTVHRVGVHPDDQYR